MTKRVYLPGLAVLLLFMASCKDFYEDDFQLNLPPEERIKISFPGLVEFEIIQSIFPDDRGIQNEVANSFIISNELNQSINQLAFSINVYDSEERFSKNLVASYTDAIQQPIAAFQETSEKVFNNILEEPLEKGKIEVILLNQDIVDNNPLNGNYVGEAFTFTDSDTIPDGIASITGAIDYKGDLFFRASGTNVTEFTISGKVSSAGLFIGKAIKSDSTSLVDTLKNEAMLPFVLQNDSLQIKLIPGSADTSTLKSITLSLTRN